jgi:hypothetical protein
MRYLSKFIQVLGILLAGGVSFFVAMTWLRPALVGPDSIAEPVLREATSSTAAVKSTPAVKGISAQREIALVVPQSSRTVHESNGDAFATQNWLPAPPIVKAPPPPPPPLPVAPVAPPLPFVYLGLIERGNAKPQAFLAKGDSMLVVVAGDALETVYRVESLSAQQIVLTHLPTNTTQTLTAPGNQK